MMKFIFFILFMSFMMISNKMIMFYYNSLFFLTFMMICIFMFKNFILINISMMWGLDYYSVLLMMMSVWIMSLMMMCLSEFKMLKLLVFMSLLMILILFFLTLDLIVFNFLFEVSLIPTFMLIIYWGVNPDRLSASYYLMMYMLLISFPLLVYIFWLYYSLFSMKFMLMKLLMSLFEFEMWSYMMIYMSFFIKLPMYMFHVWLTKAHVEAPVYGSMVLAGVLLKMGSYGLIRLMEIFIKSSLKFNYMIISMGIVGSVLVSIICLNVLDMKKLVAYSSVVHMNLMLCSLLNLQKMGFLGSYIMMVGHGLCSSGLFYMVNMYYKMTKSRLLMLNKGLINTSMKSMMIWWFILCVINFSVPFSLNFISEILLLMSIMNWDYMLMMYLMFICFFSSVYSLYLFSYVQHGSGYYEIQNFSSSLIKEFLVVKLHIYPLILMLLNLMMYL
uniref:NADH-ubiquinone oxidoreductase chain 4 n=1 Tax=Pristomyrmex punctatus TaxID=507543 RepID=E5RQ15_9HYME|nr:NADH dehydrogenase subunit 4 [Pristomyrmex punctatus]BAJ53368.1 NADH dehydrogenase subunit 4 [Pristomyrmex punctatus]